MPPTTDDTLFGFHRLAQLYGIKLVQPLLVRSQLGTARRHALANGQEIRTWPAQYRPADTFRGHFEFGLKHERLHFEFFSRLFACLPAQEVAAWVQNEPTGSYARRTAFLYEWFTGQRLDVPDTAPNVGYVDAIDAKRYLVAQNPERVRRWRVNNNLPGLRNFCPLVWLGIEAERGWLYDVAAGVQQLDDTYGTELLLRSAAWLTLKESRASFAIEHEADKRDRVHRFAAAIGAFSGQMQDPLLPHNLLTLQKAVNPPIAIGQRVQVDKGKRHRRSAGHGVGPARAQLETAQCLQHAVHQFLGRCDVVDDLRAQSALANEHRRAANTQPQCAIAQHRFLQRQQVVR